MEKKFMKLRKAVALILMLCMATANLSNVAYATPEMIDESILNDDAFGAEGGDDGLDDGELGDGGEPEPDPGEGEKPGETGEPEDEGPDENNEPEDDEPGIGNGTEEDDELDDESDDDNALEEDDELDFGDGTESNPYIIYDAESFNDIAADLSAYYVLTADIDFDGEELAPIGTAAAPFTGSLSGDGHSLSNFVITPGTGSTGLFGHAVSASFTGLAIGDAQVSHTAPFSNTGLLVGSLENGMISNVSITGGSSVTGFFAGGLAGTVSGSMIEDCSVSGNVTVSGPNSSIGGLIGIANVSTIENCSAIGNVMVSGTGNAGGLIGSSNGSDVTGCSASGVTVTGNSRVGGLIGVAYGGGSVIRSHSAAEVNGTGSVGGLIGSTSQIGSSGIVLVSECYSTGDVAGNANVGGLIGEASFVTVSNSFALGNVSSNMASIYAGGLAGRASLNVTIINCYAAGSISQGGSGLVPADPALIVESSYFDSIKAGISIYNAFNIGKVTPAMMHKASYPGWDFNDIWAIDEGNTYPYLINVGEPDWKGAESPFSGAGTAGNPYLISTAEQFKLIKYDLSAHYKLTADIDFGGEALDPISIAQISPAGPTPVPFTGSLSGGGHSLKNFAVSAQGSAGLFGHAVSASFTDLVIENAHVTGASISAGTGILVGRLEGGTIRNCLITGDNSVTGNIYVGGLAGHLSNSTVTNSSITGTILVNGSNYVGGSIGYIRNSIVTNCSVSGNVAVSGVNNTGGFIGEIVETSITGCSVTGNGSVSGTARVGGLIGNASLRCFIRSSYSTVQVSGGDNTGGLIGNAIGSDSLQSLASIYIDRCHSTGNVTGNANVGGLVGNSSFARINDSYARGNVASTDNSTYVGGLLGRVSNSTRIVNCYAANSISQGGSGLAPSDPALTIIASYFNSSIAGITTPTTQARTTSQMYTRSTYIGWDDLNIWNFQSPYPTFYPATIPVTSIVIQPDGISGGNPSVTFGNEYGTRRSITNGQSLTVSGTAYNGETIGASYALITVTIRNNDWYSQYPNSVTVRADINGNFTATVAAPQAAGVQSYQIMWPVVYYFDLGEVYASGGSVTSNSTKLFIYSQGLIVY
ncbi:MAG: hypothetical protein FWG91_10495 [Lachnospiraceae bacterium]|nr:hypothetical protein [Lachnospiraceae bacterium]